MIRMTIDGVTATATEKEVLTAGRVGLRCAFEFVGGEWGDLFKTAVFQGIETIDVALPTNECVVPWEAMAVEGVQLKVGVYGANGNGDIVIPTVWANFGKIQPSAVPSGVDPATPSQNANAYAVETAEEALAIAQSVRTDADNGVFDGEDGEGVPTGGTAGQWLKKVSSTDFDTAWADLPVEYFDCVYGTTTFGEIATAWNSTPKKIPRVIYGTGSDKIVYRLVDINTTLQFAYFTAVTGGGLLVDFYIDWMQCNGTLSPAWSKGSITVGKYSKPSGGIPKTDLASAVQTSLGKADTALQSAPVTSVNSKTGAVTLGASDVGAIESPATGTVGQVLKKTADGVEWANESGGGSSIDPYSSNPAALGTASPGSSDDYARGDHVHPKPTAADIGAIAAPGSPSEGNVLTYSSGAWAAAAPAHQIPAGGNAGECLAKNSATNYDLRWRTINDWTPAGLMRTNGGTAAKVAEWSFWSDTQYPSWLLVTVGNSNTYAGAITLKVNGKGPYPIYINGAASSSSNYTLPAGSYFVYFDGSKFDFRTDGKIPGDITGHAGGDIAAPASPTTGDFLCWNGSAWAATSMTAWSGGNY